ncbi:MAG: response regulator transcription factor [Lachnospiraceae bacterium]|jgi:DNA-binding NarL/FixJ family response regulator|nr:response regulator transcription factor [Lachnospiraceae bacterium]
MRIVIVDDDQLVVNSLKMILEADPEINVVAIGADGSDAISLYAQHKPDVLLTDIRMTKVNGLEASKKILTDYPDAKILLLTTFSDDEYIVQALKYGVKGYLLKQDYPSLLPAIKAVSHGQTVFGAVVVEKLPNLLRKKESFDYAAYGINDKELELIACVAEGLSNKEIADKLFLSEGTVRNYLSIILEKLELRDRTQLAVFYLNHK